MDAKVMGNNSNPADYRQNRELRRSRRIQRLKRDRMRKCLTGGLTLTVIICMILVCTMAYGTIRVQANTGFKYYTCITVEEGETFWSIASRYSDPDHYEDMDSYIAEVENINHLDAGKVLLAGQRLIVPYYSEEYIQ